MLDVRERAFDLLYHQMMGTSTLSDKRKKLLEYHRAHQRSFMDYLLGLAGSRLGGSVGNLVQVERRHCNRFRSLPMIKASGADAQPQAALDRLIAKQSSLHAIDDEQRLSIGLGCPDFALVAKERAAELHAAILRLESPIDRLIIALRHDVLGAMAVIDRVVIHNGPTTLFVDWADLQLKVDRSVASKISGRLRRQRPLIRTRLQSPNVRTIEFLLTIEEIAALLDGPLQNCSFGGRFAATLERHAGRAIRT